MTEPCYTTYVNWWRRRSWSERPMDISGTGEGKRGAEHSDSACEASDRVDVVSALRMLSPQQRAVVVLRYLDDLSIEQTASALGMSTSAATTHQARALARLRTSHLLLSNEEMTP